MQDEIREESLGEHPEGLVYNGAFSSEEYDIFSDEEELVCGWKTLRLANHANETAYRERLDNHNDDGDSWNFYSVSGGGIVADRTIVVPVNENVD